MPWGNAAAVMPFIGKKPKRGSIVLTFWQGCARAFLSTNIVNF